MSETSNILVTGSKGFIGKHLVKELKKDNNVIEIDLKDGNDCSDYEYLMSLPNAECVYHLAADLKPPYSDTFNGAWAVARYCNKTKARLVYTSSAAIYNAEDSLQTGGEMYAYNKFIAEKVFSSLVSDLLILRLFNVYGDGGSGVVNQFIENEKIWINGNGEQNRDYIHVDDVVRALAVPHVRGIYDIGTGIACSVNEIASYFDKPKEYRYYPYGVDYSCAKLSCHFPWRSKHIIFDYLDEQNKKT